MSVFLLISIQMLTATVCQGLTLYGNFAVPYTPLNETGYLDLTDIPRYAEYLASKHIPGVFGGTGGEGPNMNMNERQQLFQAWVTAARPFGLKVIGQVGGLSSFYDVLSLAQSCEDIGLDAIAALPHLYSGPKTAHKAVKDLKMISDAAPSLPIMYYEVTSYTKVPIDTAELYRLGCQTIPQFIGIKCPIDSALNIAANRDQGCPAAILVSNFKSVRAAFELGFNGTITEAGNLFPDLVNIIERSAGTIDVLGAEAAQARLNHVMTRLRLGEPASVGNSKAAMEMLTGIKVGDPRAPAVSLTREQKLAMSRTLELLGVPLVKPVR